MYMTYCKDSVRALLYGWAWHKSVALCSLGASTLSLTLMFCQFFFNRDERKLAASCTFRLMSSSDWSTLATATLRHMTFFIWNLIVALTVSLFAYESKSQLVSHISSSQIRKYQVEYILQDWSQQRKTTWISSEAITRVGNFPAFVSPGPSSLGI